MIMMAEEKKREKGSDKGDVEHLLEKLMFKELLELAKQEKLEVKGKKRQLISKIMKSVSNDTIRGYYNKIKGIKFDITEHILVPKHEIIDNKETEEVLKRFHCKTGDLPKILDTDPMAMKIGAKPGDVIRIKRSSPTAGYANYYRLVVRSI